MKKITGRVSPYKGKPSIFINGIPTPPQFYALTDCPTGNKSFECIPSKAIKQFSDIGFKLFQADLWLEDMLHPDGKLDISFACRQISGFTDICPDAAVMLRLHLNPPSYWLNQNPEECTAFCDTETLPIPEKPSFERYLEHDLENYYRVSYASEKWLSEFSSVLCDFLHKMKETPEWDNLCFIQIANGIYGENHYWGFTKHEPDISSPMLLYFRKFLKEKYKTDDALKKAWNNESVTLENADLPGIERRNTECGILRNPEKERNIIDYYAAQHTAVAESIVRFCKIIKKEAPELVTGAFYGYYLSLFGRQAAGGHLCEDTVLSSPYIDFLSAPQAYGKANREIGGPGLSRGLIESVIQNGKLWLSEMDQPSHYGTLLSGMITYGKDDSIQNNRKCVLEPFLRGGGMWYYDFGKYYCAGWWDDPDFMRDIAKLKNVYDIYFHKELGNAADVLLVLDTKTFFYTGINDSSDPITDGLMNLCVINSFKSGASVSCIYLSDIKKVDLSQYKCVYFINCYLVSDEMSEYIKNTVCSDGRNVIFAGNYAVTDGNTLDYTRTGRETGFNLAPRVRSIIPRVSYLGVFSESGTPSEMYLKKSKATYGETVFSEITDENTEIYGRFDCGSAAFGYKNEKDCRIFYMSLMMTEPEKLRELYRFCGCHIYSENCDALLAGQALIEMHVKTGGERTITLKNGKKITFTLSDAQTALFDAEDGKRIL